MDVELQVGNVFDPHAVDTAMAGVALVFHLAAMVSVPGSTQDPIGCYRSNLIGSLNVLEAARAHGAERVVLTSSAAVYGETDGVVSETAPTNPHSPYAAAKLAMESAAMLYTKGHEVPVVALRLFNVYGPRQSPTGDYSAVIPAFIAALLAGEPPVIFGDGNQQRDFVFIQDVAQAFVLAATIPQAVGKVFNIAGGAPLTIGELARILQGYLGSDLPPVHAPPRAGDIAFSQADIDAASTVLGFTPRVDIREGLHSTVEWFRQKQALGTP